MRRFEGRDLSLGTVKERNAPESLTPIRTRPKTATCSVDSHAGSLDQVGLRCREVCARACLLIAGVESEAGKSQAIRIPYPGRDAARRSRGVMLRRTGTVPSAGVRDGPGSAVHRSARATRCTASGTRESLTASWRPAAGSLGSRTGWPPARPCRAGSGSSCGTAPGCACRRSARTRLRYCAGRRDI